MDNIKNSTRSRCKMLLSSSPSMHHSSVYLVSIFIASFLVFCLVAVIIPAQLDLASESSSRNRNATSQEEVDPIKVGTARYLKSAYRVNVREWTQRISQDIGAVSSRTNCLKNVESYFDKNSKYQEMDPIKLRDKVVSQINQLLSQHKAAVNAIASEAERLAMQHPFVKNLRVNYTDVHRVRNELEPLPANVDPVLMQNGQFGNDPNLLGPGAPGGFSGSQTPQFTSIGGGTPVQGPPEWQTPFKSIVMQVNKNFGDIPVNTSMSAVHLPLPIYPGSPRIMNGIAWSEKLDVVFKKNLNQYMHVHHQYYGDHLGFLRTFPAHKWRIPRMDPDLFDARMRPWYIAGVSSPKDVVILVDSSGSMTGLRREIAKGVVFEILDTLTFNDYFSVMRFSETVVPMGVPKCNIKVPKTSYHMRDQCQRPVYEDSHECKVFRKQVDARGQYPIDNPEVLKQNNGSYMTDEMYQQSIYNVTQELGDAYLLPATSRNIRYLKSNFTMPTAGIANFTHALMAAFELLQAYNRTLDQGAKCNQIIMLITDGAIKSHMDIFNRYNYPNSPIRVFSYMIGREVGDITHTKEMACRNRGFYAHVINLSEVREQVQKYLPVLSRPIILSHQRPTMWTNAYGDETYQVLTDWVLELKRRERARIMLNEERERLNESILYSSDVINIELTNIPEYDDIPLVDEQLKNRLICEDATDDPNAMDQSMTEELDPLGYNELSCYWTTRRADLLTSVLKPVYDIRNTSLLFERVLSKNVWTEKETHVRNAQLLGVAAVDLRIADMLKAIPSHLLGPNGYPIIMGQSGFVMHHPDMRALFDDPFDKNSKILRPHFNALDLSHVEQVYYRDESDQKIHSKLLKLREDALRKKMVSETLWIKRSVDCRKRLNIRQQTFHSAPIKDTPFTFMISLPHAYGKNRVSAKLEPSRDTPSHFNPSLYGLWTLHPEYRYCEGISLSKNNSVLAILDLMKLIESGYASSITYDDLTSISDNPNQHANTKVVCDEELFPALLFDAAATYERPDSFCGASNFNDCQSGPVSSFSRYYSAKSEDTCASTTGDMRSKLASIYGLELSFVATRSGLTRVNVFDLTSRIKKLADLFILRHNKASDEPWYLRTVDWNMRFGEDSTVITAPYNAYVRLIAKLRQRITQRHPAVNDTRSNCDPSLYAEEDEPAVSASTSGLIIDSGGSTPASSPGIVDVSSTLRPVTESESISEMIATVGKITNSMQNDDPNVDPSNANSTSNPSPESPSDEENRVNYAEYSSFDFLDLLTNSSVHISATQTIVARKGSRQRTPVAVSGFLYDYASFARRFLNSTSLRIDTLESGAGSRQQQSEFKVDVCPNGDCPTKCGIRNDTIDCLLVDNNGFIVVGEELPHVGRSLVDYDEKLMQTLVDQKVFHQVTLIDYQAICTRHEQQMDPRALLSLAPSPSSASLKSMPSLDLSNGVGLATTLLANFAASILWLCSTLYSTLLVQNSMADFESTFLGQQMQNLRSVVVDGQAAVANQSLLAFLPNKTYLRPCERIVTYYESRPNDTNDLHGDRPIQFETRCGCSGWFVYGAVPKTNLIMLIVNSSAPCRRCDSQSSANSNNNNQQQQQQQQPTTTVLPVILNPVDQTLNKVAVNPLETVPNKTAEDLICTMLEKESQLYVRRPEYCNSYHTDESQIHLCGSASRQTQFNAGLVLICYLLLLFLFHCLCDTIHAS